MAGYETTAAVLTWTWYLLANAAWAEAALHAEIQAVCGDRSPSIEDVPKLDYCRAVIEEAMRLYPPVPILGRQAKAEDHVDGTTIAASALVLVVPWLLHRSPDLWEKPNHFMPERFLRAERPTPFSYIPFAVGQRICPGMNFGLSEAILCLATLARRFRVRLVPGHIVEPQSRLTLRPRHGLLARIEPR